MLKLRDFRTSDCAFLSLIVTPGGTAKEFFGGTTTRPSRVFEVLDVGEQDAENESKGG